MTLLATPAALAANGHNVTRGADPFGSCLRGGDSFGGVVYPATEPEVWLANNPTAPGNLVGAIQQDRWSDGGAKGLVAPVSSDGGATWTDVPLPFSACAAPAYAGKVLIDPYAGNGVPRYFDRASDPWVDIGPDGVAYAVSISFDSNDNGGAVGAATSRDGGRSWGNPQILIAENPSDTSIPFNDKEAVTADPHLPGTAYAVWERIQNIHCPDGTAAATHPPVEDDRPPTAGVAAAALQCFDGPTKLSVTTNGGHSWSVPRTIVRTPTNEQTIGNEVMVAPDGTLYDFYMYIHADNSLTIEDVSSSDQGASWSSRQLVSTSKSVGVHDPRSGAPLRTGDIIPQPAIDQHTGALYVVWQDSRANPANAAQDMLFMSKSTGKGVTGSWSAPVVVNNAGDGAAFTPAVKVLDGGNLAVAYYSLRHPGNTAGVLLTMPTLRFSNGAGTSFTSPERELGPAFNMLAAPFAGGYFTGDYQGLAVDIQHDEAVHTFFTATTCATTACDATGGFDSNGNPSATGVPDPTDVFSTLVDRGS